MRIDVPFFEIRWDEDDIAAVTECIRSGKNWAIGESISLFEKRLGEILDCPRVLAFNSGTSALNALLLAHGIGHGDEVIVPSFTFIATVNAILFVGATPVFADIEEKTFGLDSREVERLYTPRTKAVLTVHYGGGACDIATLRRTTDSLGILLLEDAASALGGHFDEKPLGTLGDGAIFSFCQNKIITTGEGGAVVCKSESVYQRLKQIRSHGRLENETDYKVLGFNFRMPTMGAALGLSQLKKLESNKRRRAEIASFYTRALEEIPSVTLPKSLYDLKRIFHLYTFQVDAVHRDLLKNHLEKLGIATQVYFSPVHQTALYREKLDPQPSRALLARLPVTEVVSQRVLSLPIFPDMKQVQMEYVVDGIQRYFQEREFL